jgi:competence protein ComEA
MPSPADRPPPEYLIRPRDRGALAAVAAAALVLLAAVAWQRGLGDGAVLDIDRATPLVAKFQVDVNVAEAPELLQLPGVGSTLAERLIADRAEHGRFRSIDDLSRVGGIGPRTLERLRPYILPIPDESEVASR